MKNFWVCGRWIFVIMISHTPPSVVHQVVPSDPGSRGILMHSALPVEACSSLDDAPLLDTLCSVNTSFCLSLFRVHKCEELSLWVIPESFVKVANNKGDDYSFSQNFVGALKI